MVGHKSIALLFALVLIPGCAKKAELAAGSPSCDTGVKYSWDEVHQETLKTSEYLNSITNTCNQKRLQLSNYEKGLDVRKRAKAECKPQPLGSAYLRADGNFYGPRNGNVWLALEATGEFRRLTLGKTADGRPAFSRDLGCWYARTDSEAEPVNPRNYGSQLLLDLGPMAASTENVRPLEVFTYTKLGSTWITTRFDQNYDIDYSFCPESLVPWEYCTALRNGNPYFEPNNLDAATKTDLVAQAIAIRSEFNYTETSKAAFDQAWNQAVSSQAESSIQSWMNAPTTFVDVPDYVWSAWRDYLMGLRVAMPDAYAVNIPTFCYKTIKTVTLSDGSAGFVSGEACYDGNGGYVFH